MTAENCQVVESALGPDFAIRMADIRRTTRIEPVFTQKTAPIIQLEKIIAFIDLITVRWFDTKQ